MQAPEAHIAACLKSGSLSRGVVPGGGWRLGAADCDRVGRGGFWLLVDAVAGT